MVEDAAVVAQVHDALWAVLWNRRYDDVDEPVWLPESSYWGILAFARALDAESTLCAVDTGEALVVFRCTGEVPPVGSRARVLPGARDLWRIAEPIVLGLGITLRFDEQTPVEDLGWIETLRSGVHRLREALDQRRERLSVRRAQLGALNEPPSLEEIWREEMTAINDRVMLATEYTAQEHAALARARAKGARTADEEERRIITARKRRFTERGNEEIAAFREQRWPEIRDRAAAEIKRYADYRTEVVRLEDTLQRLRGLTVRANNVTSALDRIERAGFHVHGLQLDLARIEEPEYAEELLRTVELLHAAIPQRAQSSATSFSAYRAPTAGPSVTPPRL
ncbi:MAG TPA: hypothetical protein VHT53_03395 [Candidatus Elarobacter sp.]|jgi:hypothetical protein|nr:hypothetical protein [Candidatus Elarobacter sp.]